MENKMKKKTVKKLEEMKDSVKNLKEMRFLLKGINIDTDHVKLGDVYPDWPISVPSKDGCILYIGNYYMGHVSNKGFYYCEFQDSVEEKKGNVYLCYYRPIKVETIMELNESEDITTYDFYKVGLNPDFEKLYKREKLEEREKNFIDIINKDMKKSFKKANKLAKKI